MGAGCDAYMCTGANVLDVPVKKIKQAQKDLLTYFSANCNSLCLRIEHGKKYSAELHSDVVNAAKAFFAAYSA